MIQLDLHDLVDYGEFDENGTGPVKWNCWNLCCEVYKRAGLFLPKYSDYLADVNQRHTYIQNVIKRGDFIPIEKPELMSIVTLRLCLEAPKCVTHMGVMISKRRFINVRRKIGVALDRVSTPSMRRRIEGFYIYAKS